MSDETNAGTDPSEAGAAVAEMPDPSAGKLDQVVEIHDAGPCRKHIKVTVNRQAIDERFNEKYTELVRNTTAPLNGFRPGKAPRKIIERRFRTSVEEQVRTEVLMASLEQLATDNKISPLAPPDLNPDTIKIPENGPFFYEFDIEVRPEFDLPNYRGLNLKRLTKTFTQKDIDDAQRRLLEPSGTLVPKEGHDVHVELNDFIVADVSMFDGEQKINDLKEVRVKVEKRFALPDGLAEDFGKSLVGAKVGDERSVKIKMSETKASANLRGREITAKFKINDIKINRLPELTPALLQEFGVRNEDQFQELISTGLERRLEFIQRQSFRQQILALVADSSKWDLPRDLLVRQSKRAFARRVMEMRSSGMSDDEIRGRLSVLEQDVVQSTALALREHFVLQKIGELENIEIDENDIDAEIERIAARGDESPRKVRARMEKDDLIEALATEILETRALDVVLENAVYEDVEIVEEDDAGSVAVVSEEASLESNREPSPTEY